VKHGILLALFLSFFVSLVGTKPSHSQEMATPSLESSSVALPNAPSATTATTCTKNDGTPCSKRLHKWIGQYPPLPESATPQPERDASTVHLWTYRGWDEPPLRTNKQVFRSKIFLATHVGGAIAMIVACRSKNSKEDWGSEVPAVAGLFGMDYLQYRFIGAPNAIAPAIYEMIHYSRASTR
jgi:hypothetical protein